MRRGTPARRAHGPGSAGQGAKSRQAARGGWKTEPAGWIARTSRSSRGSGDDLGAVVVVGGERIAQEPTRGTSGAAEEIGGAGCPEHIAPVQGVGRRGGSGVDGPGLSAEVRAKSDGVRRAAMPSSEGPGWA